MIKDKGLLKIINLEIKNSSMKNDIIHFRKRLPVKYVMKYLDSDNISNSYGHYLVLWELYKYSKSHLHQISLEEVL